jgi:signal transduction histidine kinase
MTARDGATRFISTGSDPVLTSQWLRYLGWARVVVVAAALVLSFAFPPDRSTVFRVLIGAFLICSAVIAMRREALIGIAGLLALLVDTAFFLAVAGLGSEHFIWLASAFFLYILTEGLVLYTSTELIAVAGVCVVFGAVLPYGVLRMLEPTVVVAGTLACCFAVFQQRQKSAVEEMNRRVAEAQAGAEKAREAERQRIASDFHDGPLQSFIALQMRLEILRKVIDRDFHAGMEDLKELQSVAQGQVRDLRTFLHSMRPVDVEGGNFVATARRMAETFQKESGLPVTFLGTNAPVGLPQETTTEVLQMVRESLVNVQKHAGATRVAISLENSDKGLEISIEDNGHGFPFAGNYNLEELELLRLGPASLRRRARSLNAELLLESRPGRGAGLKFRIPPQ